MGGACQTCLGDEKERRPSQAPNTEQSPPQGIPSYNDEFSPDGPKNTSMIADAYFDPNVPNATNTAAFMPTNMPHPDYSGMLGTPVTLLGSQQMSPQPPNTAGYMFGNYANPSVCSHVLCMYLSSYQIR